jgi:hypothetical protein
MEVPFLCTTDLLSTEFTAYSHDFSLLVGGGVRLRKGQNMAERKIVLERKKCAG